MDSLEDALSVRRRATITWRRRFLPPQHGAWAMLAVPYLAGLIAAGFRWPDLPLLGAWIGGYLASYYAFQAVKSRRLGRYRDQLLCYVASTTFLAAIVVATRPQVLLYAPAYAILFSFNMGYAWRRQERALLNDVASVIQSCLLVLVVATVASVSYVPAVAIVPSVAFVVSVPSRAVLGAFAMCLMYFLGTVLYVKTMIRERDSYAYRRWSIGYHALATAVAVALGPWATAFFAWLLVRAAILPGRGLTPKRVGILEIANCVLLLAATAPL